VTEDIVTHDEAVALVMNIVETQGYRGTTEEEIETVIAWARGIKAETVMLKLVLEGRAGVSVRDGEPIFHHRPEQDSS
jgi:hypothetical protein